ncbi:TRAP transporter substrate-binding protein [Chloroflexota bacterium]
MLKEKAIKLVIFGLLALLLLAMPIMSACTQQAPAPAPAPKPAPAPEKIILKAIDAWKPTHYATSKFIEMLEEINQKAAGQLEIQYVGGPEIVGAKDQLAALAEGTIDMTCSSFLYYTGLVPEGSVLGLPVVVWNWDNAAKLQNAIYDDLDRIYQEKAGVKHLLAATPLSMSIFTSKTRVAKVADMEGLKIRTTGGFDAAAMKALGAAPTKISSPEIYTAAQQGVIDGGSRPVSAIPDWKEQEVWNYMVASTPLWLALAANWYISADTYNSLPPNLQKLIMDTVKAKQAPLIKYFKEYDEKIVKVFIDAGMELVELDPGETEKWQAKVAGAAESYFLGVAPDNGQALIDKLKAAAGK